MNRIFIAVIMMFLALPAFADAPSYNYGTLFWQSVTLDDDFGDVDGDGFGIAGSFEVGDNWHIVGGYSSLGFDFGIDLNTLEIGGGYHANISENGSFYANLLWVKAEADVGGFGSVSEDGFGVAVGLRGNVSDHVELEGGVSYVDLGDGGDGTAVSGAAWYKFNDQFALGALISAEEDVTGFGIGGRFYFGK